MAKRVGTWWIRDGVEDRRREAQGFGEILELLPDFDWTQDHGDSDVLERDFVETPEYNEKVDLVDYMFMCTHGSYNPWDSTTWGRAFSTWDGTVNCAEDIDWGKWDLEIFSSHACKLLHHSSDSRVWRWIPAFKRLHYMFGFHTDSFSDPPQAERGKKFAIYAALHLFFPWFSGYTLREAWKKANVEVEGSSVEWAYLRTSGDSSSGSWVNTYHEQLQVGEPTDPVSHRTFYWSKGTC